MLRGLCRSVVEFKTEENNSAACNLGDKELEILVRYEKRRKGIQVYSIVT